MIFIQYIITYMLTHNLQLQFLASGEEMNYSALKLYTCCNRAIDCGSIAYLLAFYNCISDELHATIIS